MHRLLLAALLVSFLAAPPATGGEARKPNVLIVITDDQGLGDFSYTGNPVLKTPGLDRFAAGRACSRFIGRIAGPIAVG